MKKLIDCGNKVIGKLVSREDLDMLVREARALEAEGLTPAQAERQAVRDALDQVTRNGEDVLHQIRLQRPQAYRQASDFWNKETIRKAGMVPPPLPRFVTEGMPAAPGTQPAPVPVDAIVASHAANGGSTVNAVHGDLAFTNSFSVSIFPDLTTTVPGKNITAEWVTAFAAKAQSAGVDTSSPNISIGTWYDAASDTTYLDIAFTTTDRAQAIALGQRFNQKAIFDLNAMEEISTGGTGTVEGELPSIEERLGMASSLGYTAPRETATVPAPGTPAPAEAGVPGGAQGGIPEAGGVQAENQPAATEPEEVALPLSDAAQAAVNSLPEGQRSAAQKAFAQTGYDPLAAMQRRRGDPVSKPAGRSASPEKNIKLVADASKYGLFEGKTPSEVLSAIAGDPKQPRWKRLVADLLVQLGIGDGVTIRAVNNPNASWAGVYNMHGSNGQPEVLINLAFGGATRPDLATRLIHELVHHGTMAKLDAKNESELTPSELAARDELQKIYDYVRAQPEFRGMYGTVALREFVSEIFANEALRNKLNSTKPDGKVSLWQRFTDAVLKFLIGDRLPGMRRGSLLEKAIAEAINVAGSPMAESPSGTEVAAQEVRTRAARLINAFPTFQEHILNSVAPTTAPEVAPMADNMGITGADQIERELDHKAAFYADDERAAVEKAIDERAGAINATPAEIADVKRRIEDEVKYYRAYHPTKAGWANKAIKVLGLEDKKGLTRGDPTKQNPSGIAFKIKYKDTPYTYARDADGKPIQRFLKQGKPDKETGKPIDNPEWGKRVGQLANKMFDDLQGIMARRGKGDDSARVAQVIVDQIEWYRSMRTRLRTEFGSMSDYVADVIAGFSPITDVPGNWNNFIDYFRHVMKGDYDEAFRKFDEYISADPENRSSGTYKKEFPPEKFPNLWPRKLLKEGQPLFGANTGNALLAGLDLWRAVKSGTAPKARNFGLNLIGQSLKATIDRWAGRYLQRMHAPTWRIPPSIEGAVTGEHMPRANVELVSGDFGMGQDVFEQVAKRLQESGHEVFKEVTAADLQAILWFAEKEVWEMRKWTDIMGAGSSMNVVAQATAAQRYEAGTIPGKTSAKDEKLMAETIELRTNLNAEAHMLGAKMVPSVNIADGKESKTFDGEWITEPEYNPENSIGHVAKIAARLGKKAAHISRVIVNPYEPNPEMTPGLHIFFKGRVGDAEVKGVLAALKAAGISNGISLTVDPRVRPEVVKSLDPAAGADQYNGVRVQYISEYQAGGMTRIQIEDAFKEVIDSLDKDANVAESRVLYYDTLVLKRGIDYDSSGKLTKSFSEGRGQEWVGRAKREGAAAAARRDDVQKAIADRKRQDLELESRMEREEQERIAAYAEFQRSQPGPDAAIDGGVDPPSVAAMELQDEREPTRDPHGGRASLVRSMVNRIANVARGQGGGEIPSQPGQEVRPPAGARRGAAAGGARSAAVWRSLGETFRKREAALSRRLEEAGKLTKEENPSEGKYALSQRLFDYLTGKRSPADLELRDAVMELRREIPTVPSSSFRRMQDLDVGVEADVYHDPEGGLVYKLYRMKEGQFGGKNIGPLRRRSDGEIVSSVGERTDFRDLIARMERSNTHGLTPAELVAVTPEGDLVFAQPYIDGRGVTGKNIRPALARAGVHLLSEMGAVSGVAKLPDGRWVLYDDLHYGNVRTMPGGRVEIIDALNRELDPYEVSDLHELDKMPKEKPPGVPIARKKVQKYSNATVVAPMVETYHGTPHDWKPETKVRLPDGSVRWIVDDEEPMPKGAEVIDTAPAGRVRAEKVGAGEGHAAFGWGVLYSAQERKVAEGYRERLAETDQFVDRRTGSVIEKGDPRFSEVLNLRASLYQAGDSAEFRRLFEERGAGNLYKVQLDVNDPELLDWYMPMKGQMWIFDKVAGHYGVTRKSAMEAYHENERLAGIANDLEVDIRDAGPSEIEELRKKHAEAEYIWHEHYKEPATILGKMLNLINKLGDRYTGEKFYTSLWGQFFSKQNPKRETSELLNSVGVPGIVFLDQESRGKTGWFAISPDRKRRLHYSDKASAELMAQSVSKGWTVEKEPTTSNYVMFDPERIKVVAKNGEVVRTVADDLPSPPPANQMEPVTVAAMAEQGEDIKDGTDLTVAPMAGRGSRARYAWLRRNRPEEVKGYKPGGLATPYASLSKPIGNFVAEREAREKAVAARTEFLVKELERELKTAYGKQGPSPAQFKDIQVGLGNLDNRLTPEQYAQSLQIKDPYARRSFIETAHMDNVDKARIDQRAALARLPDNVRTKVMELRNEIDIEAKELLKDPGLDTELRARVDSQLGVYLHSNSYQHFENDVWGKHIKSDDPEAQRIRRAAEKLFKQEVIGEKAFEYQVEQWDKFRIKVTDADALAHASALGGLDQMVKTRLADYLRKDANEATRLQLLQGKMPVARNDSGKLLSLDRENIPVEVKELWGQWKDPKINFVKTYTLLANHNAEIRMQHRILTEGKLQGYIWEEGVTPGPRPHDLVPLGKAGDTGPLAKVYGPQLLKDGLANYNSPPVQDFLVNLNRWALMMKTVGNIASAVHNFFGNIAFSVANGNLLWAATMAPKTLITSVFQSFPVTWGRATTTGPRRDEITKMIELGVFDSDIAINTIRRMSTAAQAGAIVQKKLGLAAGLHAANKVLQAGARKTGGAFKQTYQAADNWWKYLNYRIELAKQQWYYEGDPNAPSLEEMERRAAAQVQNTLPNYAKVPEAVRRSLGEEGLFRYTGAFFTFQTEAARTLANNGTSAWAEAKDGNAKQKFFAAYRTAGMLSMLSMPYLVSALSRSMFGYGDDDEEALRNSLPEYQKNASLLFMLPKDEKGNARYMDVSWLNPYGLLHSSLIAGKRALTEGQGAAGVAGSALQGALHPLMTVQPGIGALMDATLNQDSTRGGRRIYNPEDDFLGRTKDVAGRFARGLLPGTALNAYKAIQSARGIKESDREPDPLQDITAGLAGAPRLSTLELDKAMASHVSKYKKRMGDAVALLNSVIGSKGTVSSGEVAAAYEQANEQAFEIFSEMHRGYQSMRKLGMNRQEARKAMQIGFGTEIRKGGLSQNTINNIVAGNFRRLTISDRMEEDIRRNHPERFDEYDEVRKKALRKQPALGYSWAQ